MSETLVHHEQLSSKEREQQERIARFERTRDAIKQMTPEQQKELGRRLEKSPEMQNVLLKIQAVAGSFWDGWEK